MEKFQLAAEGGGEGGAVLESPGVGELRLGRDAARMEAAPPPASGRHAVLAVDESHDAVSGYHARIAYDGARRRFYVVGLGRNGIFVNGVRRSNDHPVDLRSGDRLQLGEGGPVYTFLQGQDVRPGAAPTRPVPQAPAQPAEPQRAAPTVEEPRPGYVRCPECGMAVARAEAARHEHRIPMSGPQAAAAPAPSPQGGYRPAPAGPGGTTVEFVSQLLGKAAGQRTAEFFKKGMQRMVDKHVAGRLRLAYAAVAVVAVAGGAATWRMHKKMEAERLDAARGAAATKTQLNGLQAALARAKADVEANLSPALTAAARDAIYAIGYTLVPAGEDAFAFPAAKFDPEATNLLGTAFAAGPSVLVTNSHVALAIRRDLKTLSDRGVQGTLLGVALRNGSKDDYCRFEIGGLKVSAAYVQKAEQKAELLALNHNLEAELMRELEALGVSPQAMSGRKVSEVLDELQRSLPPDRLMKLMGVIQQLGEAVGKLRGITPEDAFNDVAAVETRCRSMKALRLGSAGELKAALHKNVLIAGFPGAIGHFIKNPSATETAGPLLQLTDDVVIVNAIAAHGNSGSPILDRRMTVLGVQSMVVLDDGAPRYTAGIPAPVLSRHLKEWGF